MSAEAATLKNQYVRYGSFKTVENFTYTLSPGIEPGIFNFDLGGNYKNSPPSSGTITICDGTRPALTFPDCRACEGGVTWNSSSKMWNLVVRDRRWRWANGGTVTGKYNERDDAGNIIPEAPQRKTAQQLATLCLTALGETGFEVGALPNDEWPAVEWEYASASRSLSDLCERFACRIILCTDNIIRLYAEGEPYAYAGDPRSVLKPESYTSKHVNVDVPATIRLVGKRALYQVELDGLEAVGLDKVIDIETNKTTWKYLPLSELSYKPAGGFFDGFYFDIEDAELQEAAKKTVFKYYRLPEFEFIGDNYYLRDELAKRWSQELIETSEDGATKKRRKPYLYGNHSTMSASYDPVEGDDDNDESNDGKHVDIDFSFDKESACVVFNKEVFRIDETNGYVGATLAIACAFEAEPSAWTLDMATTTVSASIIAGQERVISRDDIRNEYLSSTIDGSEAWVETTNASNRADAYMQAEANKYSNVITDAGTYEWAGIHDLSPSGQCDEVSWKISNGSIPTTFASFAAEHAILTRPRKLRSLTIDTARIVEAERQSRASDDPTGTRLATKINTSGYVPSGDIRDRVLPRQKMIYNASGVTIPAFSFVMLTGAFNAGAYSVTKPNADSLDPAMLLITGAAPIPAGRKALAIPATAGQTWVTSLDHGQDVGDTFGTSSGYFDGIGTSTGFKVSAVDASGGRVCISPFRQGIPIMDYDVPNNITLADMTIEYDPTANTHVYFSPWLDFESQGNKKSFFATQQQLIYIPSHYGTMSFSEGLGMGYAPTYGSIYSRYDVLQILETDFSHDYDSWRMIYNTHAGGSISTLLQIRETPTNRIAVHLIGYTEIGNSAELSLHGGILSDACIYAHAARY